VIIRSAAEIYRAKTDEIIAAQQKAGTPVRRFLGGTPRRRRDSVGLVDNRQSISIIVGTQSPRVPEGPSV
jgi:hypothetical protein